MPVAHPQLQPFFSYLQFEKRYSQHTIISYQTDLTSFFDYLAVQYGDVAVRDISHLYIRSWLASLKDEGLAAKSINRKISSLRSYFKYALKTGEVTQSPMGKIIAPKSEKRLPQFVADKDMATLLTHVEFGTDWKGLTEKLLIQLFYHTGMRLSEVIGLKESGVNVQGSALKVLGKGSKERIIPISNELLQEIKSYMQAKREIRGLENGTVLLVSEKGAPLAARQVYTVVKKYLSLVTTIEKRSPHILRHTFATHLTNNGADLNAVKELLGHSSLAATQVYTHNSIEKLRNVYNKAHPKA